MIFLRIFDGLLKSNETIIEKIRSSTLFSREEREMNILITFFWTNFEDQRENNSEFDDLRTTSDVDEANSMVRLKNN